MILRQETKDLHFCTSKNVNFLVTISTILHLKGIQMRETKFLDKKRIWMKRNKRKVQDPFRWDCYATLISLSGQCIQKYSDRSLSYIIQSRKIRGLENNETKKRKCLFSRMEITIVRWIVEVNCILNLFVVLHYTSC